MPTSALDMRSGRNLSTSFEQPEAASEAALSPRGAAARASSDETGRASSDETGRASSDETGRASSGLPQLAMPRTPVLQIPLLETSMDATPWLEQQRRRGGSASKYVGAAAATSASSRLGSPPTCSPRRLPRPPPTPLSRVNLEQISARSSLSRDRLLIQEGPPLRPPSSTDESSDSN